MKNRRQIRKRLIDLINKYNEVHSEYQGLEEDASEQKMKMLTDLHRIQGAIQSLNWMLEK